MEHKNTVVFMTVAVRKGIPEERQASKHSYVSDFQSH